MRPPEVEKNTKSAPWMSFWETGSPTEYISDEMRGSTIPRVAKQYDTNPEQSKQSGVVPAPQ